MPPGITVRPITAEDTAVLFRLYASTRPDVLMLPWSNEQKQAFVEMQFRAQDEDYRRRFTQAAFLIIERDLRPVGRLYIDRRPDRIHILDITLLPEERGTGIGSAFLEELQAEAASEGKRVSLYVEGSNAAQRLYQRLGFQPVETNGPYCLLEWAPK